MQLYHYGRLLEKIQGKFPPRAEILNEGNERVPYPLKQFKAEYKKAELEIRALTKGTKSDEPALCDRDQTH